MFINMIRAICYYVLLFFIYSFAGWFMESVGNIFKEKKFVNRGFLIGPYCPVYGFGVVGITLLLSKYRNDIPALFILSTVICGSLEYFTSFIMEKLFKARWWDYHNRKFNINGRICLETLIPFGIAGTVIVCIFNPLIISLLDNLSNNVIYIISSILAICFIIDFIISFKIILSFKGSIYDSKDNTEEISNKVKEKTEELSEEVKDRAENTIMQVESNMIAARRRIKAKTLVFKRKVIYTRKQLESNAYKSLDDIVEKHNQFRSTISERKELINEQIKLKQKEISNQIIEKFKKQSILSKRLMDAFPKLSIKYIYNKDDKQKK